MTPRAYLEEVVKPLHAALEADKNSLPLLYAAVTTAYHVVDYLSAECKVDVAVVTREVLSECLDFRLIYSVALAQKHVVVNNKQAFKGMSAAQIRKPGKCVMTMGGKVLIRNDRVLVKNFGFRVTVDGKTVEIDGPLKMVVTYFDRNLVKLENRWKCGGAIDPEAP